MSNGSGGWILTIDILLGYFTAILEVNVQVGSSFSLACVIEAVQRPVAADQNNANKESIQHAHWSSSKIIGVVLQPEQARHKPRSALISLLWSLGEEDMPLHLSVCGLRLGKADASSTSFCLLQALFSVTKRTNCARPAFRLTLAHRK